MEENEVVFTDILYSEYLEIINEINFTRREIDVIACLLNARRTSQIASILSIAPRTVTTHFRNIMLKLDCNSQESIISFIERSHKFPILRKYYISLVNESVFGKVLQEISKLKREESPSHIIVYWQNQNLKNALIHRLKNHLNQARINVEIREQTINQKLENLDKLGYSLLLFLEKKDPQESSENFLGFRSVDLSKRQNYYFSVFDILKKLLSDVNFDNIFTNFKDQYEKINFSSKEKPLKNYEEKNLEKNENNFIYKIISILKTKKWHFISSFSILCLLGLVFYAVQEDRKLSKNASKIHPMLKDHKEELSIRSDLAIPTESSLLDRPELLTQIDCALKDQKGIQSVALVGPGGAGKTTLARQYAHQLGAPVIWEINAETQESLKLSFENLAQALSKTSEDKKILRELLDIQDLADRGKKIVQFIKERLRSHSNWILIYDNVEKYSDVQEVFPQDYAIWGKGKVLITTRDSNIQNNKHVNTTIEVRELNPEQKFNFFIKVMNQGNNKNDDSVQIKETQKFLEHIPPFPLDVSVAAYYLKATSISYAAYLENLIKYDKAFEIVQQNLLREAGEYTKTRYGIITLSLQHIINAHKDFADLLLLISLLGSQNIPRDLLEKCKDKAIVDSFFYNIKKYSLLMAPASDHFESSSSFSIHRSTQALSLAYMTKFLNLEKDKKSLQRIVETLEQYMADAINNEDTLKMNNFISHCDAFLNHQNILNEEMNAIVKGQVGGIYFYLSNYKNAEILLKESISVIKKYHGENNIRFARALAHLGSVRRMLGDFKEAKDILEQSALIYKKNFHEEHNDLAWVFSYLGNIYRELGEYEKAKALFDQSLLIYKKHSPENYAGRARVFCYLGILHRSLGKYEAAKYFFEQSLLDYTKHSKNYVGIGWVLIHLGNIHRELGNYETAKDLLEKSLQNYKEHYSEGHVDVGWALAHLGEVYRELGDYEKAKRLLDRSFFIYKKHFSDDHVRIAWILAHLGNIHKMLGHFDKAKSFLEKSLAIYTVKFSRDHIDIGWVLTQLGSVYTSLGDLEKAKNLLEESLQINKKNYGSNHIESGRILRDLSEVYLLFGDIKKAKDLINKSIDIFQENKHIEQYTALENLAKVKLKRLSLEINKEKIEEAKNFKAEAVSCLKQALDIVNSHFAKPSPHIIRIEMKLKALERKTL